MKLVDLTAPEKRRATRDERRAIRGERQPSIAIRSVLVACLLGTVCWLCPAVPGPLQRTVQAAEHLSEGFDGEETAWQIRYDRAQARIQSHRSHAHRRVGGRASEYLVLDAARQGTKVQLEYDLPYARVIDDLELSLWVRSNRKGAALAVRVVFPHHKNPETGRPVTALLEGETYTRTSHWQQLTCTNLRERAHRRLALLRARLDNPRIDTKDMYVDRAVLTVRLPPGPSEFFLDELRFGPIVGPRDEAPVAPRDAEADRTAFPAEFRLKRLTVRGQPFFPRMTPYHGDDPETLRNAGMNVVWIPDHRDERLVRSLREHGLWMTAVPPRAVSAAGQVLDPHRASLLPFGQETAPILFWYQGTQIPASARDDLIAMTDQVRAADHHYDRPLMADVNGLERVYSRHMDMLGVSRHILHTDFSLKRYRDWLLQKRQLAYLGTFVWTWLQTEPAGGQSSEQRAESGEQTAESRKGPQQLLTPDSPRNSVVVEPEQIRLQTYAALAAGCRGLGYWKSQPLGADTPGARERRLMIRQLNRELELLEPWLATGRLVGQTSFTVQRPRAPRIGRHRLDFRDTVPEWAERNALLRAREYRRQRRRQIGGELEAAMIRGDRGLLLLPVWYQHDAQFVPGQMAAHKATIVVPGVEDTASAWEVTTTGIRSLTRERDTGGLKITLPQFDQTAAVVLTSDRDVIARLRRRIRKMAEPSARDAVDLARAKLDRVRQVDGQLHDLGVGQPDAPQILARAEQLVGQAEELFSRKDFHGAREMGTGAMQLLRILQRAHWHTAVRRLTSPVSSPYTVCFQTLPEHWRMIAQIGRSPIEPDANLMSSGGFEDVQRMMAEGWEHTQRPAEHVSATAELYPESRQGEFCLRLAAGVERGEDPPSSIGQAPVTVRSPPLPMRAGQILHISGRVRLVTPTSGSPDGVMVYDSIQGPRGGLRWKRPSGWQRFSLIREAPRSGKFRLTFELNGLGDVRFDDVRIVPHNPRPRPDRSAPADAASGGGDDSRMLDFLNSLPRLRRLTGPQESSQPE